MTQTEFGSKERNKQKMRKKIMVMGSMCDPPHLGHVEIVKTIQRIGANEVRFVISGSRQDKIEKVGTEHRIRMSIINFRRELMEENQYPKFNLDFENAEGKNIPTIIYLENLQKKFGDSEIFFVTGIDVLVPEEKLDGKCAVESFWFRGKELMENWSWIVFPRRGYLHPATIELPNNFRCINKYHPKISSSEIRDKISNGEPFEHLVVPKVAKYIKTQNLYGYRGEKK